MLASNRLLLFFLLLLDVSSGLRSSLRSELTSDPSIAIGVFRGMIEDYVTKFRQQKDDWAREKRVWEEQMQIRTKLKDPEGVQDTAAWIRKSDGEHQKDQETTAAAIFSRKVFIVFIFTRRKSR